eukprot:2106390-Prymnesium_polylepis.1
MRALATDFLSRPAPLLKWMRALATDFLWQSCTQLLQRSSHLEHRSSTAGAPRSREAAAAIDGDPVCERDTRAAGPRPTLAPHPRCGSPRGMHRSLCGESQMADPPPPPTACAPALHPTTAGAAAQCR